MSVRHINAKTEEYIAVHRNGRVTQHSSGGSGGDGCLAILVIPLLWIGFCILQEIIAFIAAHWLSILLWLGGIVLIVFGIVFWKQLLIFTKWLHRKIHAEIDGVLQKYNHCKRISSTYGRIIQKRTIRRP